MISIYQLVNLINEKLMIVVKEIVIYGGICWCSNYVGVKVKNSRVYDEELVGQACWLIDFKWELYNVQVGCW